jgi:hypothetical protein
VPSGAGKGDSRCLLYVGLALAMPIVILAVAVYLVVRFVF